MKALISMAGAMAENKRLKAENERLRFVLESILRRTKFDTSVGIIRNYVREVLEARDE